MAEPQIAKEDFVIHWPEPPHLRFKQPRVPSEPCEIEFRNGTVETGTLLHFTGRDSFLVFRVNSTDELHNKKIKVKLANVRQVTLTTSLPVEPVDNSGLLASGVEFAPADIQLYNLEFEDGSIVSGETAGHVRLPAGEFLYQQKPPDELLRIFIPASAIAYLQVGDPIGKLLVEEDAVSEAQLAQALEVQDHKRSQVLGDYLIEQGFSTREQVDAALELQKVKPSLRLGEALIALGALTNETLQMALAWQRAERSRPLGQILVDLGVLKTETLTRVRAKKLGMPYVNLAEARIDPGAAHRLAPADMRRLMALPLAFEDGALVVAMPAPPEAAVVAELGLLCGARVIAVLASADEILSKLGEMPADDGAWSVEPAPEMGANALTRSSVEAALDALVDGSAEAHVDGHVGAHVGAQAEVTADLMTDPTTDATARTHAAAGKPAGLDHLLARLLDAGESLDLKEPVTPGSEAAIEALLKRMISAAGLYGHLQMRIESSGTRHLVQLRFRRDAPPSES